MIITTTPSVEGHSIREYKGIVFGEVITGVSITTRRRQRTFAATSQVRFATLGDEEIGFYVDRYRPFDKAGAYGVQEWIGYVGVEWIEGSFYNIMGLPIQRLYAELKTILHHAGLDDVDVEALLSRCEQEGKPGTRLFINRIS